MNFKIHPLSDVKSSNIGDNTNICNHPKLTY